MQHSPSKKLCTRCGKTKSIDLFKQRFAQEKRRGWSSRCRQCLHVIDKRRERERRKHRIRIRLLLRESRLRRDKLDSLEARLHRANTAAISSLKKRKRLCKFCGDLFIVGKKKKGYYRPRLCSQCLPLRGVSSTGKFSRIVRQIIVDEDMQSLSRLLKLFRNRTTKRRTSDGTLTISVYWFLRQLLKQNFRCAICKKKIEERLLNIDHDHQTGKVRGLLCARCNLGLGAFEDSHGNLLAAVKYLKG